MPISLNLLPPPAPTLEQYLSTPISQKRKQRCPVIPSSEPQTQESAWFCLTPGRWAHRSILPHLRANGGLVANTAQSQESGA